MAVRKIAIFFFAAFLIVSTVYVFLSYNRSEKESDEAKSIRSLLKSNSKLVETKSNILDQASADNIHSSSTSSNNAAARGSDGVAAFEDLKHLDLGNGKITSEESAILRDYRLESNAILRREALLRWHSENHENIRIMAKMALSDPDASVILQALAILESRGSHGFVDNLKNLLVESASRPDGYGPAIKEAAVKALGKSKDESAVGILTKELEKHEDLSYDNVIVKALADLGFGSAVDSLERHLAYLNKFDPDESIARNSLQRAKDITIEAIAKIRDNNRS